MAHGPARAARPDRAPGRAAPDPLAALKFRFGFVCLRAGEPDRRSVRRALPKAGWQRRGFGGFDLWTHPETRLAAFEAAGRTLLIVGEAYGIETGGPPDGAALLAAREDAGLFDLVDGLGGRFALLVIDGDRVRILHDPIGSRAVFYHADAPFCVASHAALIARTVGARRRPEVRDLLGDPRFRARRVKNLPGDATAFDGVFGLAPNNLFDSAEHATRRYWPRQPVAEVGIDGFLATATGYLATLAAHVAASRRPVFGLTGGVDTRSVFAAFRALSVPFETVTWLGGRIHPQELPVTERIAALLAMPHRTLDIPPIGTGEVARIAGRNGGYRGPCRLAQAMHSAYGDAPGRVFIRCWGGEIMRGFYNTRDAPMQDYSVGEMVRAYGPAAGAGASGDFVTRAFEGFRARGNYAALERFDHDPNDMFYWEHRMGMWGAASNNEMDVALPTLIGLNGRGLFAAAFGLPRARRLSKRLLLELTAAFDPELARIPLAPDVPRNRVALGPPERVLPLLGRLRRRLGL